MRVPYAPYVVAVAAEGDRPTRDWVSQVERVGETYVSHSPRARALGKLAYPLLILLTVNANVQRAPSEDRVLFAEPHALNSTSDSATAIFKTRSSHTS